jgi:selenide,water dikinase
VGEALGKIEGVSAMTDVTGFGFLGHLVEMAEGSGLSAIIDFKNIPVIISDLSNYLDQKSVPGGTVRNWDSYGKKIGSLTTYQQSVLADPQTSGGLLIAVNPNAVDEVKNILQLHSLESFARPVGVLVKQSQTIVTIKSE